MKKNLTEAEFSNDERGGNRLPGHPDHAPGPLEAIRRDVKKRGWRK